MPSRPRAGVAVDGGHRAGAAVGEATALVVAQREDPVAGLEAALAVGGRDLGAGESAIEGHAGASDGVERFDVDPTGGDVIYLEDIAVYPASGASAAVGAVAVLRAAPRERPKQFQGSGASSLAIRGTRVTGANPGRTVEITISLTQEEETNEHDS